MGVRIGFQDRLHARDVAFSLRFEKRALTINGTKSIVKTIYSSFLSSSRPGAFSEPSPFT
jgi:hypothetical protein